MKKNQAKNAALRRAHAKKLTVSDGHAIKKLTAGELAALVGCSRQHAYKLIADPARITPATWALLRHTALNQLPGFPPGWYADAAGLHGPRGQCYTVADLENFSLAMELMRGYERDVGQLKAHIEWLQRKLAAPPPVRDLTPGRVIAFPPRPEKTAPAGG